jgi:hypothetical protein
MCAYVRGLGSNESNHLNHYTQRDRFWGRKVGVLREKLEGSESHARPPDGLAQKDWKLLELNSFYRESIVLRLVGIDAVPLKGTRS